jgi:thiamine biosynthesis lipoprotein
LARATGNATTFIEISVSSDSLNRLMKSISAVALFLALACTGSSNIARPDGLYRFNYENVLGTSLELKFSATSETQAQKAAAAALGEIDRESKILSSWDNNSEVSRWARTMGEPVRVSPELFEVLGLYDQWRIRTGGALDASAEAVIRVWKNAATQKRLPTRPELDAAVAETRRVHWRLDASAGTAMHLSDTPLVLASFTKSYILSRATDAAMKTGVDAAVVNIGGDLTVRGTLTEPVVIADPHADAENQPPIATLAIHGRAVATSGDYRRGFDIGGQHYSHIVDPRTGMPADDVISSTVTAPNAVDAGALATAFSVMKPEESERLAKSIPGVEYLLVKKNGERVTSSGWNLLAAVNPAQRMPFAPLPAAAAGDEWDPSMALTLHVELARSLGFAKRPYLAAWVEDGKRANVRTLALWYGKPRYLDELRAWSRTQHASPWQTASGASSVSGATRGPGNYTIDWDGKDSAGRFVKTGRYTVYLEVVREHGTYQLMKREMNFDGTPSQVQFPPNTEVAGASFDYHRFSGR